MEGWSWFHRIAINHTKVPSDQLNFLFYFVAQTPEFANAQSNGADFLFTLEDGVTKLSHEILHWDPIRFRLEARVLVPHVSSVADTVILLLYGNPNCSDQQDVQGVWKYTEYARGTAYSEYDRAPTGPKGGALPPGAMFEMQIRLLEELFGAKWFSRPSGKRRRHPAFKQWKFCSEMRESGGRIDCKSREEFERTALSVVNVLRIGALLVKATKGVLGDFKLGELANYGDENVIRRLKAVIEDGSQFRDVMAELNAVAWFLSKGCAVTVYEKSGWADFKIEVPGWNFPVIADSKRVGFGSSPKKAIKRDIEKCNKQVKAVKADGYGLAIIDVTEVVSWKRANSDEEPPEVVELKSYIQALLRQFYRSLSAVMLVWDEPKVLGPEGRGAMVLTKTRSTIIQHSAPLRQFPDCVPISIGWTFQTFILTAPNPTLGTPLERAKNADQGHIGD